MTNPVSTILVGAGGYGANHGRTMLENAIPEVHLTAIVDPYAKNSPIYDLFKDTIPVYNQLEDFYATGQTAQLAIIASPHHLHYQQCVAALKGGSHVLCEKPLVPDLKTLNLLDEEVAASGKTLSVGFQWCSSSVMRGLKSRIIAGEFGKPVFFKNYTSWPRDWKYYNRNSWAGRIKTDDGQLVNDAVASNATSHHLQNMLFLLGSTMEDSASLNDTYVEIYRANNIETFDTCVLRGDAGDAKVLYIASHATNYNMPNPIMQYELEKAIITVGVLDREGVCIVHHRDGRIENLGNAMGGGITNNIIFAARAAQGEGNVACSIRTVRPFTALIDAIFSQAPIHNFLENHVHICTAEERTYIPFLHMDLVKCFNNGMLPSEIGYAWAEPPTHLQL